MTTSKPKWRKIIDARHNATLRDGKTRVSLIVWTPHSGGWIAVAEREVFMDEKTKAYIEATLGYRKKDGGEVYFYDIDDAKAAAEEMGRLLLGVKG